VRNVFSSIWLTLDCAMVLKKASARIKRTRDDVIATLELESLQEMGDLVTQNVQKVNGISRTVTCIAV